MNSSIKIPTIKRAGATSARATFKFSFRMLIVMAYVAVAGCGSTKTLDRPAAQGDMAVAIDAAAIDTTDTTASYPEQTAGTVTELYGEDAESEQSQSYRDAVAENALLRYIIVYFDFNQVDLREESREVLVQHAAYLSQHSDVAVKLEGHADKRGSGGYNLALGERRALAVKNFLDANGVQSFQSSTVSYGEERPALEGDGEEIYTKNRRVELIYR